MKRKALGYCGQIVSDWGRFEQMGGFANPQAMGMLNGALQAFTDIAESAPVRAAAQAFARSGDPASIQSTLQAYATSADFPTTVLEVMAKYQQTSYFDTAYEQIFQMLDMRNSNRNGFDITDVTDALSFKVVEEGAKAKLYGMSGTKTTVTLDQYGGGLSWSRRLFDDKEYWTLENNAVAFRNQWFYDKAVNFYALIDAVAASQDLAWQAVEPAGVTTANENYNAIRDIETINTACENILLDVKDKGYGVSPMTPFVILAPIQLKGRLTRALGMVQQPFASSTARQTYNVSTVYSLMLSSSTEYYVVLPGHKIQGANRMDLTTYLKFDPLSYSDISVGWGRYGGAIGDIEQIQRCGSTP